MQSYIYFYWSTPPPDKQIVLFIGCLLILSSHCCMHRNRLQFATNWSCVPFNQSHWCDSPQPMLLFCWHKKALQLWPISIEAMLVIMTSVTMTQNDNSSYHVTFIESLPVPTTVVSILHPLNFHNSERQLLLLSYFCRWRNDLRMPKCLTTCSWASSMLPELCP